MIFPARILIALQSPENEKITSIPKNFNDMTNTNCNTMLISHCSDNSLYLKLTFLEDTYSQLYPHLSCCLCLHFANG